MPTRSELDMPCAGSGLRANPAPLPASAASTAPASWPSTTVTEVAREARAAITARSAIGTPSTASSSLFSAPIRVDRPAASTSAATRGPSAAERSAAGAPAGSSASCSSPAAAASVSSSGAPAARIGLRIKPPTPIRTICSRPTGSPASRRCNTQSRPFRRRERPQPGSRITGTSSMRPSTSMLPGSVGMPKCSTVPPAATSAAGAMSRRSLAIVAPDTSTRSHPAARAWRSIASIAPCSCAQRNTSASRAPITASR